MGEFASLYEAVGKLLESRDELGDVDEGMLVALEDEYALIEQDSK